MNHHNLVQYPGDSSDDNINNDIPGLTSTEVLVGREYVVPSDEITIENFVP
jgi:hypothetical protein